MTMLAMSAVIASKPALHEGKNLVLKRKNAQLELDFATVEEVILEKKLKT